MIPPRGLTFLIYALFGVCPLLFFTDLTRNPYFTQIVLLNILVCACWLLWLWQAWKQKEWVWVSSPLDRWLLLLIGVCLASWISSFIQHPNFRKPIYSEGSRAAIFLIVNTGLAYAAAVRFLDRERLKRVLWISYAVAFFASAYGIAQYFGSEWFWPQNLNPYGSRPVSTFGNPNFMSSYLVLILSVAISDFLFKATGLSRVPLFVVILASTGALIATLTRSSWAGAAVAIAVVGLTVILSRDQWPKLRRPVFILATALLLMVFFWPKSSSAAYSETVVGRIAEVRQVMKGTYGAVTQRLLIWLSAWGMVQDHPLLGKGWGCFELFFPYYQGAHLDKPVFRFYRTHANNAHNEVLEYWAQTGILGLGAAIFLWVVFFRLGLAQLKRLPGGWKGLEGGLLGGVAGVLVDNLLNVSVHFAVPALVFWWWVGSALALDPAILEVKRFSLQSTGRRLAMGAAALMLIAFSVRSARVWAEEVHFFEGFKLSKRGENLTAARLSLEKAYAFFQRDVNNNYELANVYARLGRKEDSLQMYQRALDANAGYDEIYFNRGTMYAQMGRDEEAIRNYRMVLAMNPLSRDVYNALAGLYLKDIPKHGQTMETIYRQAVQLFPEDKELWNNLGYLEVQLQRWPEAYAAYSKALELDPTFEVARRNLALVAPRLKKPS
jgi:O-antigen ligase/Tfp pilus assembly protein PilF